MRLEKNIFFSDNNSNSTNYCYDFQDNKFQCVSFSGAFINFWDVINRDYLLFKREPNNNGFDDALTAYRQTLDDLRNSKQVQCIDSNVWINVYRVFYDGEIWMFQLSPNFLISIEENQLFGPFVEIEEIQEKKDNYIVFLDALIGKIDNLITLRAQ